MADRGPDTVGRLLEKAGAGDREALSALLPLVYDELRRVAARQMRRERAGATLQATALVHEAYLRLLKDSRVGWQNRAHFFAIAANSMRQILVERARARGASKRGGGQVRVTLDEGLVPAASKDIDIVALDEALTRLASLDPEQARIVELRFFAGLTIEETAQETSLSPATVKRRLEVARAWLHRELS
jgi:RNA polymerase sigma factor (TIGR02999 family)